ncbi:ANTAR domain-containing protein [Streptomyces sp. NPDC002324]
MSEPAHSVRSASAGAVGCATMAGPPDGRPTPTLSLHSHQDGDRVVVTVRGDLELATDEQLRRGLRDSLARSTHGIDLDLGEVGFCDCSGLNALLGIRQEALDHAKTATIRTISRAAQRVFSLTDTLSLFLPPAAPDHVDHVDHLSDGSRTEATALPAEPRGPDPRVEIVQLRRALETRDTIDLARGILMAAFALSPDEAWHALVRTSQNTNTKLHLTARQLVDSCTGTPVPPCTRERLSAAVAQVTAERAERALPPE